MIGRDFLRIGHGGASALAPANTLASFDAALAVGIDMIEFDVRAHRGQLVLAHTIADARWRMCVSLRDALGHLASPRFSGVSLNLDVKHVGCEAAILAALDHQGLTERTLVSSQVTAVLDRFRDRDPKLHLGISVGGQLARASRRWQDWRTQVLDGLACGRWNALMAQHRLIDGRLVQDVEGRGGSVYAWTVNEWRQIRSLRGLGVHGVTTADPRLFIG